MVFKRIKVGVQENGDTNCYIVQDERTLETMVVDPGGEIQKIINMLDTLKANVKYIYLTHCHGDHIGAVNQLREKYNATVLIHRFDEQGLKNGSINLSSYIGMGDIIVDNAYRVDGGDIIHVGDIAFKVIYTPGHTIGSSSLYCKKEKLVFSGDTIFRGAWGRTDLPTGDFHDVISSITNGIMHLPDDTIIYPGHGKSTMVKEERPIYEDLRPRTD